MSNQVLDSTPHRLLPHQPEIRDVALEILDEVSGAPIVSPHGHVPARLMVDDVPFANAADLLVSPDHYVTRLLHADGLSLPEIGIGEHAADPRAAWRRFCERWPLFDGTASGLWLREELSKLFGIEEEPNAMNADELFIRIAGCLARPDFRPRALLNSFNIDVLATTDDPLDTLEDHRVLASAPDLKTRVIPTFRPDRFTAGGAGFADRVDDLTSLSQTPADYDGYLAALRIQRRRFIDAGAVSSDHGVRTPRALRLTQHDARQLFDRVRLSPNARDSADFEAHMTYQSARMSVEDGLVMTLHPGVHRDHHPASRAAYGPDRGHDIPFGIGFTRELAPLLADFGTEPNFQLILFTIDETTLSREVAPLAGFYPSVYVGSPWWFLDAPDAMMRFRRAVTETAGFSRTAGFVDDTRALCSIPARHDVARRVDARYLAELVHEQRLTLPAARRAMRTLTVDAPRRAFRL